MPRHTLNDLSRLPIIPRQNSCYDTAKSNSLEKITTKSDAIREKRCPTVLNLPHRKKCGCFEKVHCCIIPVSHTAFAPRIHPVTTVAQAYAPYIERLGGPLLQAFTSLYHTTPPSFRCGHNRADYNLPIDSHWSSSNQRKQIMQSWSVGLSIL